MNLTKAFKDMFSSNKSMTSSKVETNLVNELSTLNGQTMPMSLQMGGVRVGSNIKSRATELAERLEMYEDASVRVILDVKVGHALGATDSTSIAYTIKIKDDIEISDEYRKLINDELKYFRDLSLDVVKTLAKDGEALSKGFCTYDIENGQGIKKISHNYTTSIRYMNEIKDKLSNTVAFEVAIESDDKKVHETNNRKFVNPDYIGCLNAESNGYMGLQSESFLQLETMNPFNKDEVYHEDFIYGGSFEGVYNHYKKYVWALEALFNARVSSSVIERFIIHNLDGLGAEEVKALKKSLLEQMKIVGERLKEKVSKLDPTANTINMYIPTVNNGVNSVNVVESDKNYNLSVDDIFMHIKTFIGAIGFNMALTPYGGNERGGEEEDGVESKSLIMDSQSDRIRDGVTKWLKRGCQIHLKHKYYPNEPIELDESIIEVTFVSVTNKAQLVAETQRLQSINNSQQVAAILEQYKALALQDTDGTRLFLKNMLKSVMPQTTENIDEIVSAHIEYILTPPPKEEE